MVRTCLFIIPNPLLPCPWVQTLRHELLPRASQHPSCCSPLCSPHLPAPTHQNVHITHTHTHAHTRTHAHTPRTPPAAGTGGRPPHPRPARSGLARVRPLLRVQQAPQPPAPAGQQQRRGHQAAHTCQRAGAGRGHGHEGACAFGVCARWTQSLQHVLIAG